MSDNYIKSDLIKDTRVFMEKYNIQKLVILEKSKGVLAPSLFTNEATRDDILEEIEMSLFLIEELGKQLEKYHKCFHVMDILKSKLNRTRDNIEDYLKKEQGVVDEVGFLGLQ
jgi:hypothetical protein